MKHVLAELEISLATQINNEPIWRAEGNIEQADSAIEKIVELEQAITILTAVEESAALKS